MEIMSKQFIVTQPFNVSVVEEKGEQKVFLDGIISSTDPDLVNDIVTLNCLKSMKRQIEERNIKLDVEHEAFRGDTHEEKEINKTKIPVGRLMNPTIEEEITDKGPRYMLRVKGLLNSYHKRFNEVKGSTINKFLDAFSIAYIPTKTVNKVIEGKTYRLLDDVILLNVAQTGNPVNTNAELRDIYMKSVEAIQEKEKECDPKEKEDEEDEEMKKYKEEKKGNELEVKSESHSPNGVKLQVERRLKNMDEQKSDSVEAKDFSELKAQNEALKSELTSLKDVMGKILENQNKAISAANVESKEHKSNESAPQVKSMLELCR